MRRDRFLRLSPAERVVTHAYVACQEIIPDGFFIPKLRPFSRIISGTSVGGTTPQRHPWAPRQRSHFRFAFFLRENNDLKI